MSGKCNVLHEKARLPESRIVNVDLSDSEFDDVNLRRTIFHNVEMTGVRFQNVNLSQSVVQNAKLDGMTINGILVTDLLRVYEASGRKD